MRRSLPYILLCFVAAIAVVPLVHKGPSCGHDFTFHIESWLDAAAQLRHGTLYPRWAFSAGYNAGEPRFVFYPPLSWMLGGALTILLPITLATQAFTFISLSLCGATMFRFARTFVSPALALLAATAYIISPYMLFNAYERTAYAELLAAAWLPLVFLATLRRHPRSREIALALALLWLTNAPAAVMGSYTLLTLVLARIVIELWRARRQHAPLSPRFIVSLLKPFALGGLLGFALVAFYLLPALRERPFVSLDAALSTDLRYQDNFLFHPDAHAYHDAVNLTATIVGCIMLGLALLCALWLFKRQRPGSRLNSQLERAIAIPLLIVGGFIAFLEFRASSFLWAHLPQFKFLQFPWRLLAIFGVVLAALIALALRSWRPRMRVTAAIAIVATIAASATALAYLRQGCGDDDLPAAQLTHFQQHQGLVATDEYASAGADNDLLRVDSPPAWFSRNPQSWAEESTPDPDLDPTKPHGPNDGDPATAPVAEHAPFTLDVPIPRDGFLILNLRRHPRWVVTLNGAPPPPYTGDPRDDGLVVLPVHAGTAHIAVRWRRGLDEYTGDAITLIAAALFFYRRRTHAAPALKRTA